MYEDQKKINKFRDLLHNNQEKIKLSVAPTHYFVNMKDNINLNNLELKLRTFTKRISKQYIIKGVKLINEYIVVELIEVTKSEIFLDKLEELNEKIGYGYIWSNTEVSF